jgi:hypothetical protein
MFKFRHRIPKKVAEKQDFFYFIENIEAIEELGRIFCGVPQKTGLCGGSVTPSKKSHALHGFFAWRDRYAPLQSHCARTGGRSRERITVASRPRWTGSL